MTEHVLTTIGVTMGFVWFSSALLSMTLGQNYPAFAKAFERTFYVSTGLMVLILFAAAMDLVWTA